MLLVTNQIKIDKVRIQFIIDDNLYVLIIGNIHYTLYQNLHRLQWDIIF